jgi:hypothetical protein
LPLKHTDHTKEKLIIMLIFNTQNNPKLTNFSLFNTHGTMRNVFLIFLLVFAWSCEEDFSLNAPYKDITVIYGLIDPGQDTIFLKINKAFLGDGNVMEMAKIEDSSEYVNGLTAVIEEWENGSLMKSYNLDTVTIKNKEEGIFYNPYQVIYYTPFEPVTSRNYLLRVEVNNNVITAQTNLINDFSISKPSAGSKFIMFRPGTSSDIDWTSAKYGKRYEITIRIKYKEVFYDSNDTNYTYIDWSFGTKKSVSDVGGEDMKVAYNNDGFYSLLADQVPYSDPTQEANVKARYTNDVDFIIAVGGTDLNTYMEVNEPSNSIVQDRPEFTNIENGTGIFSTRFRSMRTKKIHPETIQEIKTELPELKFVY